jgi:endogenous inhibitor of DNA gyrase (YacG/DUF329 family)
MPNASDARCVLCRRQPVDPAWRPFCSERCKVRDLANWADESYRVGGEPLDADDSGDADDPGHQTSL